MNIVWSLLSNCNISPCIWVIKAFTRVKTSDIQSEQGAIAVWNRKGLIEMVKSSKRDDFKVPPTGGLPLLEGSHDIMPGNA